MKNLSRVLLGTALVVATSSGVFAAVSGTQSLASTVSAINSLALTDASASMSGVDTTGLDNVKICDIKLNNNSPTGFKVTFSSAKGGKMVRYASGAYADVSKTGNWLNYTIAVSAGTGTLGTAAPTLPSAQSLSSDYDLTFDTAVDRSTIDKVYDIKVSTVAKDSLFNGSFQDTITATIADI
ncbi:hypothetical protein EBR57_07045 [bacterium]|nr:hypothetical protein [bacterium]